MNATGAIVFHEKVGPLNSRHVRYEWQGGRIVEIGKEFVSILKPDCDLGSRFLVGPYRLKVVKLDHWCGSIYAIQEQGIVNRLLYLVYRATPVLEKIYRRLIVTAHIWGCAGYEFSCIPSWKDLHLPWRKPK